MLIRILIAAAVILFLIMWIRAVIDVFRRNDLSGGAKAGWTIIMLIVPFIGLLVYTMLRPENV
jgi:hypothetical protein